MLTTPQFVRLGLFLLILLGLGGCGGAAQTQPLRFRAAPWRTGEQATYTVTANEAETAGSALFSVAGGGETWTLRRHVRANGDEEIAAVELLDYGFRPLLSTLVRTLADGGTENVRAVYEKGVVDLELTTRQAVTTFERINVPTDARDQRSLPFLVRALPLADGYVVRANVFLPVTGQLDRVTISVTGRESVSVPAGLYESWRVRLDTGDFVSQLWVAVDTPHALVKFDDGQAHATYELLEFISGE